MAKKIGGWRNYTMYERTDSRSNIESYSDAQESIQRLFLRRTLFRIDFQVITEKIQEDVFQYAVNKYRSLFSEQTNEQEHTMNIQINTLRPESSTTSSKLQNVFVLSERKTESCDGRVLKIGRTFIFLEINFNIKSMKIEYINVLQDVINYMKKQCEKMFRPTRIGLRKSNKFYLLDDYNNKLDSIFKKPFFYQVCSEQCNLKESNLVQSYEIEKYIMNYITRYSSGMLEISNTQKLAHLIEFDFDFTSIDKDIIYNINEETWDYMRERIYNFFKSVVRIDTVANLNERSALNEYGIIAF